LAAISIGQREFEQWNLDVSALRCVPSGSKSRHFKRQASQEFWGHAGRRTLKWAWIEAAHGAVRRGGRFGEIFDRRTDGGKRDRNRGYITVGQELCRIVYAMWNREVDYSETPPPRPGRGKRRRDSRRAREVTLRTSRPGTGQPDDAMVAVPM